MGLLDGLNDRQYEAASHVDGPLLIIAGAGSGKTRVLTHRVAYLISEIGVKPYNIMAITFTNKAAGEMRERVDKIVGFGAESIWVSTFHSMCVRILRRHAELLGYADHFVIYDSEDNEDFSMRTCLPVAAPDAEDTAEIHEKKCVHLKHRGGFSTVWQAHGIIRQYAEENGIPLTGRVYEEYHKDMSADVYYAAE